MMKREFQEIAAISKQYNDRYAILAEIRVKELEDDYPDLSWLETEYEEDRQRLKDYGYTWYCIGIRAEAIIYIPVGQGCFSIQAIKSSGLWGIESDSGKEYLEEVGQEQVTELLGYLRTLNVKGIKE